LFGCIAAVTGCHSPLFVPGSWPVIRDPPCETARKTVFPSTLTVHLRFGYLHFLCRRQDRVTSYPPVSSAGLQTGVPSDRSSSLGWRPAVVRASSPALHQKWLPYHVVCAPCECGSKGRGLKTVLPHEKTRCLLRLTLFFLTMTWGRRGGFAQAPNSINGRVRRQPASQPARPEPESQSVFRRRH
jgi:hypothetical protein